MFSNATISSRSSSSRSANSCSRNSSMPSLRMRNPLSPKTSYNPLFRHSDAFTSFDASHFVFQEHKKNQKETKRNPILRRYYSHDSNAKFEEFDSNDNTPDSTKSRNSDSTGGGGSGSGGGGGERKHQEYEARDFLERYSLPRVVRVGGGEPLLLYRCFDSFTKIQAKGIVGKKGKEKIGDTVLYFPEGYSGWFSLTNEKGEKSAILHTTILQLVREQVCSFLSMQPFTAYASQTDIADGSGKVQYLKTQVRAGQLFQLRAVFQHKDRDGGGKNSARSSRISRSTRDKDLSNRYAQLVSQNNQELYVPLTTKGEFYEIHSSMKARLCFPGMLDKTGPLALDKDCLYRITHLLRRVALPLKVKLISGPLPYGLPKDYTDTFILEKKFQEPLMVTCTIPPPSPDARHEINCINLNSNVKISRSTLGFESENRLFKSQRLQAALAFCHKNVENWYREVRLAPNIDHDQQQQQQKQQQQQQQQQQTQQNNVEEICVECKKLNCGQHSKINSSEDINKQLITKEVLEKFPKPKKWYKHFKILSKSEPLEKFADLRDPMDGMEKGKSIERYKDMSKLIEEKFGRKSYNPVKKSASFMFSTKRIDLEETKTNNNAALLKCQSLDTQLYSISERRTSKSNISDNLSYDFQMCILENDNSLVDNNSKSNINNNNDDNEGQSLINLQNLNEIKPFVEEPPKLKKNKPDLIPTLPKQENSYITERLCSEFHVKTKVQTKRPERNSGKFTHQKLSVFESSHKKSVVVQVHESSKEKINVDDIPYSQVADEVAQKQTRDENIYAEICDNPPCNCDNKLCSCKRTRNEYGYVKLGSNGDSVTQSDSDEAIYNTLR